MILPPDRRSLRFRSKSPQCASRIPKRSASSRSLLVLGRRKVTVCDHGGVTDVVSVGVLDSASAAIMGAIVETAQAPHYAELAKTLDMSPDDAKQVMHELCATTPGWMHPGTDWLGSFPPFNVQPTQYRITVDDRHGWFGQ